MTKNWFRIQERQQQQNVEEEGHAFQAREMKMNPLLVQGRVT